MKLRESFNVPRRIFLGRRGTRHGVPGLKTHPNDEFAVNWDLTIDLAMSWIPFCDRLSELPLILAGPTLQHTASDSVTVWVALQQSRTVELLVYATRERGSVIGELVAAGGRATVHIGQHLHVVAITASLVGNVQLQPGQIYAYTLRFEDSLTLPLALISSRLPEVSLSYFPHQLPTFSLPPEDLDRLILVHGSCRKMHGQGEDALTILDAAIAQAASEANGRPHQLFLTGDRIYADDVADALLWAATELGDTLLGWEEPLPLLPALSTDGATEIAPKQLRPGSRGAIAQQQAGLTAGLEGKSQNSSSHLLSFGEYCAAYLLCESQVFWTEPLPSAAQACQDAAWAKVWDRDLQELNHFRRSLPLVRRALANIPTYSIFDDHDVTDDWFLNQGWCLQVLGKPLGRRVVHNAMLAYAVFQAWGNTPERFGTGTSGAALLDAARDWSKSAGRDRGAGDRIRRYLGLPETDPVTDLPKMRRDGSVWILDRDPQALTWHYTVRSDRHEIVILDTRTWRGYPSGDPLAPPMLLCPSAFERQLRDSFEETDRLNATGASHIEASLVVVPTNLFGLEGIDWIQRWYLKRGQVFARDVGDAWNFNEAARLQFLTMLFQFREQVAILSGDIHYGSAVRVEYWWRHPKSASFQPYVLAQLTSSALKNTEFLTRLIHTRLKQLIWSERQRWWIGRTDPPEEIEVVTLEGKLPLSSPDWVMSVDWMPRQDAQIESKMRGEGRWKFLNSPPTGLLGFILNLFWRNRWLQEGNEVVGLNNLGVVRWEWSEDVEARAIKQDLYWYTSWGVPRVVSSHFRVSLERHPFPGKNLKQI